MSVDSKLIIIAKDDCIPQETIRNKFLPIVSCILDPRTCAKCPIGKDLFFHSQKDLRSRGCCVSLTGDDSC
jgi:hypothetical protein